MSSDQAPKLPDELENKRIGDMSTKELKSMCQHLGIAFMKCRVVEDDSDEGDSDDEDGSPAPAAQNAKPDSSSGPSTAPAAVADASDVAAEESVEESDDDTEAGDKLPPSMFTVAFHERQIKGVSEQPWAMIPVPFQVPSMDSKSGRPILKGSVNAETACFRIPAKGRAYIIGAGATVVHSFDYTIPHVSSTAMPTLPASSGTTPGFGMMRTGKPALSEFPGYEALEKTKWFQLNPTTDPYTVQVRMTKLPPEDIYRSISRGEYFVYSPIDLALRPPVAMAAVSYPAPAPTPAPTSKFATATLIGATSATAGPPDAIRKALHDAAAKAAASSTTAASANDIDKVTNL